MRLIPPSSRALRLIRAVINLLIILIVATILVYYVISSLNPTLAYKYSLLGVIAFNLILVGVALYLAYPYMEKLVKDFKSSIHTITNYSASTRGQLTLFLASLTIRLILILSDIPLKLKWGAYDTWLYIDTGREYIRGLATLNITAFKINIEHPPLAKLMIGAATYIMAWTEPYYAAAVLMCITSSLICLATYRIGLLQGREVALLAWLLVTFDPFPVRWTTAWLDTPMLLFITLSVLMLLKIDRGKQYIAVGLLGGLAILCKYTAIPLLTLLTLTLTRNLRKTAMIMATAILLCLTINPQLWSIENIEFLIKFHFMGGEAEWIKGENVILAWYPGKFWWRADTFIWTFLYYFGLSQSVPNQPFITPFIAYIVLIHKIIKRERVSFNFYWVWLSISLITLAFFTKHWPYYDVIYAPPLVLITATLLSLNYSQESIIRGVGSRKLARLLVIPALIYILLTPISLTASLVFPTLWLFILTLLNSKELFPMEYYLSLTLTVSLLIYIAIMVAIIIKNTAKHPNDRL